MVRETTRSRIVRFVRRWRLRAALGALGVLALLGIRGLRSPAPPPVPEPAPPAAAAPADPPAPVTVVPANETDKLLSECLRRRALQAPAAELAAIDAEFERHLGTLPPLEVLGLLSRGVPGAIHPLLLRAIDNGLAGDRPAWEGAFTEALGRVSGDLARLEGMGAVFFSRVRDPSRRASACLLMATGPDGGGLLVLAAREAPPEARERLREVLWARTRDPGAVEALGELVEPREADRLASLGPDPAVRRALQAAYERTKAAAFQAALEGLR
jgi:hypothetical protein